MRRIALALLLLLFGCTATELLARATHPSRNVQRETWLSRPASWADSDYYSTEFVDELMLTLELQWTQVGDTFVNGDQHGTHVNVRDGIRRTTDQPDHYTRTVWMFGSSHMFSFGVPDEHTIASHVQRLLPDVRVMNMGVTGATVFHALERLKMTNVQAGDTVLFYTGQLDWMGWYDEQISKRDDSSICIRKPTLSVALSVYRDACLSLHTVPVDWTTLDTAHRRYLDRLNEARQVAITAGAAFVSVFEAGDFANLRPDERNAACQLERWPGIETNSPRIVQVWRRGHDVDLSDLLAGRDSAVFIDCGHTNEHANASIARAIADTVR